MWWYWQSPSNGAVTIDTAGSSFDTRLGVYTGTQVDALRTLAENDDDDGLQSRVTLDVTAGTVYRLRVAGFAGATGDIVLNWNLEAARHQYIFPQFAFGGGWESTLMVKSFDNGAHCTFSAQDRFLTMQDHSGSNLSGTSLPLAFGRHGWTILKTETPQGTAASSGMAVLDCDEEVSANTLFSLEVGGSLATRAIVTPAEEIRAGGFAHFLADHRDGSRLGWRWLTCQASRSTSPFMYTV